MNVELNLLSILRTAGQSDSEVGYQYNQRDTTAQCTHFTLHSLPDTVSQTRNNIQCLIFK